MELPNANLRRTSFSDYGSPAYEKRQLYLFVRTRCLGIQPRRSSTRSMLFLRVNERQYAARRVNTLPMYDGFLDRA